MGKREKRERESSGRNQPGCGHNSGLLHERRSIRFRFVTGMKMIRLEAIIAEVTSSPRKVIRGKRILREREMAMVASQEPTLYQAAASGSGSGINRTLALLIVLMGTFWNIAEVRVQTRDPLVLFCWRGYVPKSVTDAFTKETGIQVIIEYYSSNEELLRYRLVDRRFDLVQPSDYALEALVDRNALEPLRHDRIPNLMNIDPKFRSLPHDPDDKYSVPWMAGTVGIVVDTSRVKESVRSYADVFSGKYRGRIVALSDAREWLGWARCIWNSRSTRSHQRSSGKFAMFGRTGCPKWLSSIRTPLPMS